jgi:hypothetical protein
MPILKVILLAIVQGPAEFPVRLAVPLGRVTFFGTRGKQ